MNSPRPDTVPKRLDRSGLYTGLAILSRQDPLLADAVGRDGTPPLWARRPGLETLIRIILEQQVSLLSARAVFNRVSAALGGINQETILAQGIPGLRNLGMTRQKARYCIDTARSVAGGELNLKRVARAPVVEARAELMRVKGIGPWTADIYLLMALRRPDIWPPGDIALLTALQHLRQMPARPTIEEAEKIARQWSPWRAVAARVLWHGYLCGSLRGMPGIKR